MASTDSKLLPLGGRGHGGSDGAVIAQYVVTKITFWGSYRRILTLTATHAALYDPDDFTCTNQWFLSIITDIEIAPDPDQFILVLEKVRFQAHRLRFHCPARSHLIAQLHRLRRKYSFLPLRVSDFDAGARQKHYECSEHYADDSYDYFMLKVGLSGVTLLDENGRKVARFPYLSIQRIATSTAHPDGLVISTVFEERLFLCHPRNDCIDHMCAAARALGVALTVNESPLNMQLLRLRNSQVLDNPAVVCFEVTKKEDGGKIEQHIQLIFQGTAIIEVHRRLRTIITRPYNMLLTVVPSAYDNDTVVLQFVHDENLVVRVDSRDQFVAILLLVCRESGNEQVELSHSLLNTSRLFRPHVSEHVRETTGTSMESFFLNRVLRILSSEELVVRSTSQLKEFGGVMHDHAWTKGKRREKVKRHHSQRRRGLRPNAVVMEAQLSKSMGMSLNDHIELIAALEELNTNVPLSGFADSCNRTLLNRTIEVLVQHLVSLAKSLRSHAGAPTDVTVTTLQSLARMAQSRHAFFSEDLIPPLFDALYAIVSRRHFLTSYWVLKLLQCYFEPRKSPEARRYRAMALQTFMENCTLLYAILDVIPESSSLSRSSSGRWMRQGSETIRPTGEDESDYPMNQDLDQTLLFTKEERLEKDMNILTYEALFTLHHVLIFLLAKEKQEGEAVVSILSKTKLLAEQRAGRSKHWASTINLDDTEYDLDFHQANYDLAAGAKRGIGEKLMAKYKFLMDSVVDVRLARSCQTIVALINFVVNFFRDEINAKHIGKASFRPTLAPPDGFVLYEDERADPDGTMLYQVGSDTEYRRKRATLPMRRSSLDVSVSDVSTEDTEIKKQERQLNELFAFLECYQADVATLDNRSRLFPEQNTILLPLMSFSRMSSANSSSHSIFYVSGITEELVRLREREEDFLTLDQLRFDDDDDRTAEAVVPLERRVSVVSPAEQMSSAMPRRQSQPRAVVHHRLRPSLLHPSSSTNSDDFSIVESRLEGSGSSYVPRFMAHSNFRRLDDARLDTVARQRQKQQGPHRQERPWVREQTRGNEEMVQPFKPHNEPRTRPSPLRTRPTSIAINDRISAHTCDACIACNDVCENENCFFCAEKEFQLQAAFSASSLPRSPVSATLSSSLHADRKYSSCEVSRHQSARSCWIIVFGFVYDVTDLLSSHPGGMDVLLTAAAVGKDMGELFIKKHPPRARRVLENYFLGEFYHCENRTVLV